jgi:uncharacterized protein (TIGR03032 family)
VRLPTEFVKLPVRVDADALAAEVAALPEQIWREHPEGAAGNTAVPLVGREGDPFDDAVVGPMAPTPYLAHLPYAAKIMASLGSVIGRTRLMRIEEEGHLDDHVDTNYYWRDHMRVHVPVATTPDVEFLCNGRSQHMAAGEVWVFDTWLRHGVRNPAGTKRIHLVIDTVGSAGLWDLLERPDRDAVLITPDGPSPALVTELINGATVMSPWEFAATVDQLAGDLQLVDPDTAARFVEAMAPFRRAWRETWARFGEFSEGVPVYAQLRQQCSDVVEREFAGVCLVNRLEVHAAVLQQLLRPAVRSDETVFGAVAGAPSSAAAAPATVLSPRPAAPTIDRPVFIVSSPRSGSSLLFETLARSPGLWTIGGESHQVIEGIAGLHPARHGWDSNRLAADEATPATVAELQRRFVEQLRDRNGNPVPGGAVRMLEKTPKNSLRVPLLAAAFPDARFVYLYRDPRETISSMLDAWKSGRFVTYRDLPGWNGPAWSLLLTPGWRELAGASLGEIVTAQWSTATSLLLDDLEVLDPDRWCVTSYDRLLDDPQAEMQRLCEFCEVDWDVELSGPLPLSRHTLDSPAPQKWLRNADELEPHWDTVREVATRAHEFFAQPPRVRPVRTKSAADVVRQASTPAAPAPQTGPPAGTAAASPARDGNGAAEDLTFNSVFSASLPELLDAIGSSLCVSTYQSGRMILVRAEGGQRLNTHFRGFQTPMGVATRPGGLAIGTKTQVHVFQDQAALSARLDPPGRHDAVYVPREAHSTGDIRIHDLAWVGDELWAVNTRFSCLSTFDPHYSFVPRWRPSFVTELAPQDRCHLNGMAVVDGEVRYVTALGTSDEPGGWRERKTDGGVLLHVPSGEVLTSGLCMPHSPRWHDGRLWMLESGLGAIHEIDPTTGAKTEVTRVPGFTRGMSFAGPFAFVGLSQVRETLFEGIPLRADGVQRSCGVWAIDLRSGRTAAFLRFEGIVQELYEVAVLAGQRWPEIVEPGAEILDTAFVLPDEALAEVPGGLRS